MQAAEDFSRLEKERPKEAIDASWIRMQVKAYCRLVRSVQVASRFVYLRSIGCGYECSLRACAVLFDTSTSSIERLVNDYRETERLIERYAPQELDMATSLSRMQKELMSRYPKFMSDAAVQWAESLTE